MIGEASPSSLEKTEGIEGRATRRDFRAEIGEGVLQAWISLNLVGGEGSQEFPNS
jgi:hypothetical protein